MAVLESRRWTMFGLLIALFGIPAIITAYHAFVPDPDASGSIVLRELLILALTAFLMWIVVARERKPLSSIGLRGDSIGRSLAWGVALAIAGVAAILACLAVYGALGIHYGSGTALSHSLPVTFLTIVRAGISEEVFYRGYAIERLHALAGSKWIAAALSLAAFVGFHYRQGLPGMGLVLAIGLIFTGFYLWKRNLLALMVGHFLIDFVPNVLLPLVSGESS